MTRDPGEVFEAIYEAGESGLAGNLAVAIHDNQSNVVYGPTILQIVELIVDGQPTGTYRANLTAPDAEGTYSINWSNDGSFDPQAGGGEEDLFVEDSTMDLPSLGGAISAILCNTWTSTEEMILCCDFAEFDSSGELADASVVAASEALYLASGKQYPGICGLDEPFRPCATNNCGCGYQVLSRGHLVGWRDDCWGGYNCGCRATSRVKLAGYVQEIVQVKIDGIVIDPSEYFVYEHMWLTRKNGGRWPSCQSMDVEHTEEGSFSVDYTFGKAPPVLGQIAAMELACEISKACTPGAECALPNGVVRIVRQSITIERNALLRDPRTGVWQTGMGNVDLFLNTVNPHGLTRSGVGWSAVSGSRFARPGPE